MTRPAATGPPIPPRTSRLDVTTGTVRHPDLVSPSTTTRTETMMADPTMTLSVSETRREHHPPSREARTMLALDLGTTTGWAVRTAEGVILSGTVSFRPTRYDGGGMRYLRFRSWLEEFIEDAGGLTAVWFEEVRRHVGTDAGHVYGGMLATLSAWCETRAIAYQGVPVGTIKRHVTGKGNASKKAMVAAITARGFKPADDNEADALAILLWAIETAGGVR